MKQKKRCIKYEGGLKHDENYQKNDSFLVDNPKDDTPEELTPEELTQEKSVKEKSAQDKSAQEECPPNNMNNHNFNQQIQLNDDDLFMTLNKTFVPTKNSNLQDRIFNEGEASVMHTHKHQNQDSQDLLNLCKDKNDPYEKNCTYPWYNEIDEATSIEMTHDDFLNGNYSKSRSMSMNFTDNSDSCRGTYIFPDQGISSAQVKSKELCKSRSTHGNSEPYNDCKKNESKCEQIGVSGGGTNVNGNSKDEATEEGKGIEEGKETEEGKAAKECKEDEDKKYLSAPNGGNNRNDEGNENNGGGISGIHSGNNNSKGENSQNGEEGNDKRETKDDTNNDEIEGDSYRNCVNFSVQEDYNDNIQKDTHDSKQYMNDNAEKSADTKEGIDCVIIDTEEVTLVDEANRVEAPPQAEDSPYEANLLSQIKDLKDTIENMKKEKIHLLAKFKVYTLNNKKEIEELKKKCQDKEDQIEELKKKCQDKEDQIEELTKKCRGKEDQIEELTKKCQDKEDQIEELKKKCQDKEDQIEELTKKCRGKEDQIEELTKKCRGKEDQIEELTKKCQDKEEEIERHLVDIKKKENEIDEIKKICNEEMEEYKRKAETELKMEVEIEKERHRELNKKWEMLNEINEKMDKEAKIHAEELKRLETENNTLTEKLEELKKNSENEKSKMSILKLDLLDEDVLFCISYESTRLVCFSKKGEYHIISEDVFKQNYRNLKIPSCVEDIHRKEMEEYKKEQDVCVKKIKDEKDEIEKEFQIYKEKVNTLINEANETWKNLDEKNCTIQQLNNSIMKYEQDIETYKNEVATISEKYKVLELQICKEKNVRDEQAGIIAGLKKQIQKEKFEIIKKCKEQFDEENQRKINEMKVVFDNKEKLLQNKIESLLYQMQKMVFSNEEKLLSPQPQLQEEQHSEQMSEQMSRKQLHPLFGNETPGALKNGQVNFISCEGEKCRKEAHEEKKSQEVNLEEIGFWKSDAHHNSFDNKMDVISSNKSFDNCTSKGESHHLLNNCNIVYNGRNDDTKIPIYPNEYKKIRKKLDAYEFVISEEKKDKKNLLERINFLNSQIKNYESISGNYEHAMYQKNILQNFISQIPSSIKIDDYVSVIYNSFNFSPQEIELINSKRAKR
ncbi:hypothetical protein, conserved [Plasmodium gonderi]|uniref:GRIP domain-containing protein n=1 Tax=Plasmodium gonderi TaxID=77519 RepID=A0A1Y1JE42_PLAGO|nr:hypothetical protein, conserved [Plasmodium gonderi]GAW80766.1 hypothetical protein, conserved [Plasmodium gonderi]